MLSTVRMPRGLHATPVFFSLLLVSEAAHANSAMGLKGIGEAIALMIGICALVLSALLGAAAWVSALKPPSAVGWIFGRGFLGVSAVIAFAIGGFFTAIGMSLWFRKGTPVFLLVVGVLALVFMAVEFFIAGTLYRRAGRRGTSKLATPFAFVSHVVAVVLAVAACVLLVSGASAHLFPAPPGPSPDVRRYKKGCDENRGSDCNMLGLRHQSGGAGPRDPARAAVLFRKSCDLGTPIGCSNLSKLYSKGDGVPRDETLAKEYADRFDELRRGR